VEVPGPGSDSLLAQTVQQMKSLELSNMNIVTFKASKEEITLTDVNGCVWVWVWAYRREMQFQVPPALGVFCPHM